jgi:hypothetical protein
MMVQCQAGGSLNVDQLTPELALRFQLCMEYVGGKYPSRPFVHQCRRAVENAS